MCGNDLRICAFACSEALGGEDLSMVWSRQGAGMQIASADKMTLILVVENEADDVNPLIGTGKGKWNRFITS
jgi:hypothetical protein